VRLAESREGIRALHYSTPRKCSSRSRSAVCGDPLDAAPRCRLAVHLGYIFGFGLIAALLQLRVAVSSAVLSSRFSMCARSHLRSVRWCISEYIATRALGTLSVATNAGCRSDGYSTLRIPPASCGWRRAVRRTAALARGHRILTCDAPSVHRGMP